MEREQTMKSDDPDVVKRLYDAVLEEAREVARRIDQRVGQARGTGLPGKNPDEQDTTAAGADTDPA